MWFKRKRVPTFAEVAEDVLKLKRLKSKRTYAAALFQIARLKRYFAGIPVTKISEGMWTQYVLLEKEKRARKFFDDRKYMRIILTHCQREGLIEKRVQLPIPDLPWDAGRELAAHEIERLLSHASDRLTLQIEIAWKMGLRLREMLHLRWDQFDWENSTIIFRAEDVKTRRKREVPINPDLIERFRSLRVSSKSLYVFPSSKSLLIPQDSNKTAWCKCKRAARVSARWHDLRHSAASGMLRKGVKRSTVRVYLGMSERVLSGIYEHLNLEDLRHAAEAMSNQAVSPPI